MGIDWVDNTMKSDTMQSMLRREIKIGCHALNGENAVSQERPADVNVREKIQIFKIFLKLLKIIVKP